MININFYGWDKVARVFAEHSNLTIEYVDEEATKRMGALAWAARNRLYVLRPNPAWDEKRFVLWLYLILHETGHVAPKRRPTYDILERENPQGLMHAIFNLLEDHVQERQFAKDNPIVFRHLERGRAAFYDKQLAEVDDEKRERMQSEAAPGGLFFAWDASVRGHWEELGRYFKLFAEDPLKHPQAKEWLRRLQTGGYEERLLAMPDPEETWQLANDIAREVFEDDPEQAQSGADQRSGESSSSSASQGDSGEGAQNNRGGASKTRRARRRRDGSESDGTGGSHASKRGSGGDARDAEAEAGDTPTNRSPGECDYRDLLVSAHAHQTQEEMEGGDGSGGLDIDYTSYFADGRYGEFVPSTLDEMEIYDFSKGQRPPWTSSSAGLPGPSTLSRRISRYLQARSKSRVARYQKSGKLGKNLARLKTKGASPEWKQRVFTKKIENKSLDVAVTLLVDCSGSMDWDGKAQAAVDAATHMHEVLCQSLHIPVEIIGFTERGHDGTYPIFQSFRKQERNDVIAQRLLRTVPACGSNADGEALLLARHRLLQQKAARKILVVLSDGQPASGRGDVVPFTRDTIEQINKEGLIDMYAIGIMSDSVTDFYRADQCAVINHSDELEGKLLHVLQNKIIL